MSGSWDAMVSRELAEIIGQAAELRYAYCDTAAWAFQARLDRIRELLGAEAEIIAERYASTDDSAERARAFADFVQHVYSGAARPVPA